ncbi:MAG TPA: DUF6153 family protein [Pseudonocardiaceae bacterium]
MSRISTPTARLLCVFAVVVGLMGMHGLAARPGEGCHSGMSSTAAASPMAAMAVPERTPASGAVAIEQGKTAATGGTCVFVQPAGWVAVVLVLLAIIAVGADLVRVPRWATGTASRSPPRSGMSLLQWVCVSRT